MRVTAEQDGASRQGASGPPGDNATSSFAALYRSVIAALIRFLALRCEKSDVDDVAAEIMAEVYSQWNRAPTSLESQRRWVFGFARNKLREYARRRKYQITLSEQIAPVASPGLNQETIVIGNDRVNRLLSQLPAKESDVVQLTILGGFSCAEAAQILGISTTAVTTRAARARQHLKQILQDEGAKR